MIDEAGSPAVSEEFQGDRRAPPGARSISVDGFRAGPGWGAELVACCCAGWGELGRGCRNLGG